MAAPAAVTWAALRGMDFYRLRWIRWLLAVRLLPERLAARLRGEMLPPPTPTFSGEFFESGHFLPFFGFRHAGVCDSVPDDFGH